MYFFKYLTYVISILFVILLLSSCSSAEENESVLSVSAASSLTDALSEIISSFESESGIKVEINFGSSSMCARQIKEGKSTSVFISANEMWMTYLQDLYVQETDQVLLNNSLVLAVPVSSEYKITELKDLLKNDIDRIAMGDPSHVPGGIYGRKILEQNGLWDSLEDKVVGSYDVRAALSLIETGSVNCGIIFRTDAMSSEKVKTVYDIPMGELEINYLVSRFDDSQQSIQFYNYLFNTGSRSIFEKYGFMTKEKG